MPIHSFQVCRELALIHNAHQYSEPAAHPQSAKSAPGTLPFCDHRCPPDVTPENYLYYLDLKEQMFGMK
jgi:hypothetical protein